MYNKIIYTLLYLFLSCNSNDSTSSTCDDLEILSESINFSLEDKNEGSSTYGEFIGPDFFSNTVRLFYFSDNPG